MRLLLSFLSFLQVGEDPFHTAVMRKHLDAASELLQLGWSVNCVSSCLKMNLNYGIQLISIQSNSVS